MPSKIQGGGSFKEKEVVIGGGDRRAPKGTPRHLAQVVGTQVSALWKTTKLCIFAHCVVCMLYSTV